ncbi:hypothetical protein LZ30DRAFT_467458 [Colletotrichum cereale]|nr:hypothetical protein LZ30DRAFT_467458 [Colletotrichum cereale]
METGGGRRGPYHGQRLLDRASREKACAGSQSCIRRPCVLVMRCVCFGASCGGRGSSLKAQRISCAERLPRGARGGGECDAAMHVCRREGGGDEDQKPSLPGKSWEQGKATLDRPTFGSGVGSRCGHHKRHLRDLLRRSSNRAPASQIKLVVFYA